MFVGNRNNINLSSSRFSDFINDGSIYIDKTAFIEHVLQDASNVLLFTRPRRMGKSLNMNTLATFLDRKQDTAQLFKGLYMENSPVFSHVNKYPVIYLDFVNLDSSNLENLQKSFRKRVLDSIENLLDVQNLSLAIKEYINDSKDYSASILASLIAFVAKHYGKEPFLIIDEYDKVIMDTLNHPEGDEIKNFIVTALQSTLKGTTYFKKAILTGVTRTAKENLFSGLNNIVVYDIFTPGAYDADFSLTDEEMLELVPKDKLAGARKWYNNMRVGSKLLYNIYSVMNYLSNPEAELKTYWARTGGEALLAGLMNDERLSKIARMVNSNYSLETRLDRQLNMNHLKDNAACSDVSFYTLAAQAGYLSHNHVSQDTYEVYIPNEEAKRTWARLILDFKYDSPDSKLSEIFKGIHDTESFSAKLTDFTSMRLSYYDIGGSIEKTYHVFFLGLYIGAGYTCISNLESDLGRFDILIKAKAFNAIIDFKVAGAAADDALCKEADTAIEQITDKEYWQTVKDDKLPLYKIGIACYGKKCLVKTVLHIKSH